MLLTLAGVWGVGYAVAGLALTQKAVSSVTNLLANLAFLISGALVPLPALGLLSTILNVVFPMTWGIEILRDVVLNGTTLIELMQNGMLLGLGVQTAVFLLVGLFTFNHSLQQVRRRGELGSY